MDIIPKAAVILMERLSKDYTVSSWRIQGSPNMTISFKLESTAAAAIAGGAGPSQVQSKFYRSKPPSSVARDMQRQASWLESRHYNDEAEMRDSGRADEQCDIDNYDNDSGLYVSHTTYENGTVGRDTNNMYNSTPIVTNTSNAFASGFLANDSPNMSNATNAEDITPSVCSVNKEQTQRYLMFPHIPEEHEVADKCIETDPSHNAHSSISTQCSGPAVTKAKTQTPIVDVMNGYSQTTGNTDCARTKKHKRTQTQRQPYGEVYIQTKVGMTSNACQTTQAVYNDVSIMTDSPFMSTTASITESCRVSSRHIQTYVYHKNEATQYKLPTVHELANNMPTTRDSTKENTLPPVDSTSMSDTTRTDDSKQATLTPEQYVVLCKRMDELTAKWTSPPTSFTLGTDKT